MAFEMWCIVELFGHNRLAGKVTEQEIGGETFIRVDVPEVEGQKGFTKFYGKGAIYSMTPVDESTARLAIKSYRVVPIEVWRLEIDTKPKLASGEEFQDGDDVDTGDDYEDDEWDVDEPPTSRRAKRDRF